MPALVPFVTTLVFAAALHAGGDGYTVGRGDTLSGIAERTGVSSAELARANAITDPNLILAGQVLDVPQPAAPAQPSTYTVRVGDTLTAIAAGIRTLYLQAAVDSPRASGALEAPDLLGAFLTRAHAVGMQVVAWYVPT